MPNLSGAGAKKAPTNEGGGFAAAGKTYVDLLVIDDMENVAKKLKSMLPERISFTTLIRSRW